MNTFEYLKKTLNLLEPSALKIESLSLGVKTVNERMKTNSRCYSDIKKGVVYVYTARIKLSHARAAD